MLIGLLLVPFVADSRSGLKRTPYWVVTVILGALSLGYWTFAKADGRPTFFP